MKITLSKKWATAYSSLLYASLLHHFRNFHNSLVSPYRPHQPDQLNRLLHVPRIFNLWFRSAFLFSSFFLSLFAVDLSTPRCPKPKVPSYLFVFGCPQNAGNAIMWLLVASFLVFFFGERGKDIRNWAQSTVEYDLRFCFVFRIHLEVFFFSVLPQMWSCSVLMVLDWSTVREHQKLNY